MLSFRSDDGTEVYAGIEGHKTPFILDRKSEQIQVGELARAEDSIVAEPISITQRDVIEPEIVVRGHDRPL